MNNELIPEFWQEEDTSITREFTFDTFDEALEFITQVAGVASEANHHPEIYWSYRSVVINLTTHDEGEVTEKDVALAEAINELTM